MPYPLNNVTTSNGYTAACTATPPPGQPTVFVQIAANGAAFYTVTYRRRGAHGVTIAQPSQTPEKIIFPGQGPWGPPVDIPDGAEFIAIQFRSATAGVPTFVSVT